MDSIVVKGYAKVNLSIDVLGILENGYHELDMIMHMTGLHDDVKVSWKPDDSGELRVSVSADRDDIPAGEDNIAYRAALAMAEGRNVSGRIDIEIVKRIPAAAGLAGGSADSAAVILALDRLWGTGLDLDKLMRIGRKTGADVPFSVAGCAYLNDMKDGGFTCARAIYDGSRLIPLPSLAGTRIVLSKPPVGVSTKEVYQGIDNAVIAARPDIERLIEAIEDRDTHYIKQNMINVLENYTLKMYNVVKETMDKFTELNESVRPVMSGSGPTVFAIVTDEEEADLLSDFLKKTNSETYLTGLV